jgi:hypothetical protein
MFLHQLVRLSPAWAKVEVAANPITARRWVLGATIDALLYRSRQSRVWLATQSQQSIEASCSFPVMWFMRFSGAGVGGGLDLRV